MKSTEKEQNFSFPATKHKFVMADKPRFAHTVIAWEGLWQRLTLLFMYLPLALLCARGAQ